MFQGDFASLSGVRAREYEVITLPNHNCKIETTKEPRRALGVPYGNYRQVKVT